MDPEIAWKTEYNKVHKILTKLNKDYSLFVEEKDEEGMNTIKQYIEKIEKLIEFMDKWCMID